MKTQTLALMIADCRERADMENTQFITDVTITRWLNKALCDLWDMLIRNDPDFAYSTGAITTVAGTASYAVPADFYKHRGVDRYNGANVSPTRLEEFTQAERIGAIPLTMRAIVPRFAIRGNGTNTRIWFDPDPGANTYTLHYATACPTLVNPTDTFDGVSGWEDWPILKVVISMLNKEKQSTTGIEKELARVEAAAISASAQSRNSECETSIALVRPSFRRGNGRILDW